MRRTYIGFVFLGLIVTQYLRGGSAIRPAGKRHCANLCLALTGSEQILRDDRQNGYSSLFHAAGVSRTSIYSKPHEQKHPPKHTAAAAQQSRNSFL